MKYVILSPGRTGSTFLLNVMGTAPECEPGGICNATQYRYPCDIQKIKSHNSEHNMVIHTHQFSVISDLKLDPLEVTLIISRRKAADLILSYFVANLTNEWSESEYTDKIPTPVTIPLHRVKGQIAMTSLFYKTVEKMCKDLQFAKVINVSYEDMEFSTEFVSRMLGIHNSPAQNEFTPRKSPYSYKDWILNWQEIVNVINESESF